MVRCLYLMDLKKNAGADRPIGHDRNYLIIEGSLRHLYRQQNQVQSLQQFLNRMSSEVLPVVYTESLDETIRFVRSHNFAWRPRNCISWFDPLPS